MGNSNGSGGQEQKEQKTPHADELGRLFEFLAENKDDDSKVISLTQDKFQVHFSWQEDHRFGRQLFGHVWGMRDRVEKMEFIKELQHLLHQGSSTQGKLLLYCSVLMNGKTTLYLHDLIGMFDMCWCFTSIVQGDADCPNDIQGQSPVVLCLASTALMEYESEHISPQQLVDWVSGHIPSLFDSMHQWIMGRLLSCPTSQTKLQVSHHLPYRSWSHDAKVMLTQEVVWLLSMLLPGCYLGNQLTQPPAASNDQELVEVWTLLYDCVEHGQSLNRFKHHCFSYRGPTLLLAKVDSDTIIMMAIDTEWRESSSPWGKSDCVLLQLQPTLKLFQGGPSMVFFNERSRGVPSGVRFGPPTSPWITIDTDLSSVQLHYRNNTEKQHINKIEVWGCGGQKAKEFQMNQQKWERTQAERSRKIKLPGKWDENPDKAILEMAGVRTSYSQR